jgi:hypothetical protein
MTWAVVLLDGVNLNASRSSIEYDQFGQMTFEKVFVCDTWQQGFEQAKSNNFDQALFVKSGTIFTNWPAWKKLLNSYPHQGLIGHLIWHPGQQLTLDQQCWFADLNKFSINDLAAATLSHVEPVRSVQNLHDDYTPLWVKPGRKITTYKSDGFGQGLIAKQLNSGCGIVNWNNLARQLKLFAYDDDTSLFLQDYRNLAESQLWVLNNEPVVVAQGANLLTPGSGMVWMLNLIDQKNQSLQVVDISKTQIKFCQKLWESWDGNDYGEFVWDFIKENNLIHYEIDIADLDAVGRLKLRSKSNFVNHVNNKFNLTLLDHNVVDFSARWQYSKTIKTPKFDCANLIDWVLKFGTIGYDSIWCSNILRYKWTLLNSTCQEFQNFVRAIDKLEHL